jgi:hypothetical protein
MRKKKRTGVFFVGVLEKDSRIKDVPVIRHMCLPLDTIFFSS